MAPSSNHIPTQLLACIIAAWILLVIPLPWIAAWSIAVSVHELGHFLAVRLCGGRILSFRIGLRGAVMEADGLTTAQSAFCSLAGPVCGGLLIGLSGMLPRVALCALVQTAYNLLPIYPLDGGRILRNLLALLTSDALAVKASKVISVLTALLLCVGCFRVPALRKVAWIPAVMLCFSLMQNNKIKIPCKPCFHRVQ